MPRSGGGVPPVNSKRLLRKFLIIVLLICAWELVSLAVHSKLIMASPIETISAFFGMVREADFYSTILFSTCRVLLGFLISCVLAIAFSALAYNSSLIKDILQPIILLMKSIPVASFIIIALLWMGSKNLSVFIVVLVALPILYTQLLTGLENTPKKYLELAEIFRFKTLTRVLAIYLPSIREGFISACRLAVGMSFKAGIAAEVISGIGGSIGEKLYFSKLYFSTGELFAWTGVIVALSFVCEKIVVFVFGKAFDVLTSKRCLKTCKGDATASDSHAGLSVNHATKTYTETGQLFDISLEADSPEIIAVCGPSGKGKTTFLHILAGLTEPDEGTLSLPEKKSIVFQDTRLLEHLDAIRNVMCACPDKSEENIASVLTELLPTECLDKPVSQLSGGERRRVELVRAFLADSQIILLDEPFTGLDEEMKSRAIEFIKKHQGERIIVCTAHEAGEVVKLNFPQKGLTDFKLWITI